MALHMYAQSLRRGGRNSANLLRLVTLEAIELIIKEKAELETKANKQRQGFGSQTWSRCTQVYKFLSHHYILRRSVVFIFDSQFDSVVYRDKAMHFVRKFCKEMDAEDHFGFITLDQKPLTDEVILERSGANHHVK